MLKSSASFSLHSENLILINLFHSKFICYHHGINDSFLTTLSLSVRIHPWTSWVLIFVKEIIIKSATPSRRKTNLWSLKELALYRCVVSFSRLLGRLMIVIASNGHFCEMKNINLMPLLELLWVSMFGECLENKAGWLKC